MASSTLSVGNLGLGSWLVAGADSAKPIFFMSSRALSFSSSRCACFSSVPVINRRLDSPSYQSRKNLFVAGSSRAFAVSMPPLSCENNRMIACGVYNKAILGSSYLVFS